jgi:phage portal protein BeeE
MNQARPSAVLTTDLILDKDQVQFIRDRWDEQSKGLKAGGTPILTGGLKPMFLTNQSSKDAELADVMKLSEQRIALAFRIPLQILGIAGGTPFGSTELLMQSWIATGLGFALNHIEEAFGLLFALDGQPDEYVEFDTKALLRSAFKDRIAGLAQAVQGGIFSPNEARAEESLDSVQYGDEPRVQQQVVPLSAAAAIPAAPPAGGTPPGASQSTATGPSPPTTANKTLSAEDYNDVVASELRNILARADYHDRSSA